MAVKEGEQPEPLVEEEEEVTSYVLVGQVSAPDAAPPPASSHLRELSSSISVLQ